MMHIALVISCARNAVFCEWKLSEEHGRRPKQGTDEKRYS